MSRLSPLKDIRHLLIPVIALLLLLWVSGCQTPDAETGAIDGSETAMLADDGGDSLGEDTTDELGAEDATGADETVAKQNGDGDEAAGAVDAAVVEIEPIEIKLDGSITNPDAEISSMAWHGDTLILMPQYPGWEQAEGKGDGVVYAIARDEIVRYLEDPDAGPITPREIAFDADGLDETIDGFEGFEALAFDGDRAYLAVEAQTENGEGDDGEDDASGAKMFGLLVAGDMDSDGSSLAVDSSVLTSVNLPVNLPNMSIESLVVGTDMLYALFEANGANVNEASDAASFNLDLTPGDWVGFPTLEYRVTDATALAPDGTLWVSNYYWPGEADLLVPAPDVLAEAYGEGNTHARYEGVERLVRLQLGEEGFELTPDPPVQLSLLGDDDLRNWEGIARLGDRGWLLATDSFPTTMLVFVPAPASGVDDA